MPKPRPLSRDHQDFRDDRLFIIACDDTYAPEQYFNSFNIPRIQVHVVPTKNGTSHAKHVLERLLEFDDLEKSDERWMILDIDHCTKNDSQKKSFIQALKKAESKNVNIALSNPCFEIWLIMHFIENEENIKIINNAKEAEGFLKKLLGTYNKTNLNNLVFDFQMVINACELAKKIDRDVGGGHDPIGVTSRIYKIWESIIKKSSKSQLPDALKSYWDLFQR